VGFYTLAVVLSGIALAGVIAGVMLFARGAKRSSLALIASAVFLLTVALLDVGAELMHDEFARDIWSEKLIATDPILGTLPLPAVETRHNRWILTTGYQSVWDVTYRTEADRSRHVPARPPQGPRLALFGGSFTFGEGLDDKDTIANLLQERLPHWRVFNYGVRGHGTAQNYLYLRQVMARWPNTRACVVGFITDHVRRTAMPYRLIASDWAGGHPRVESRDGAIYFRGTARDALSPPEKLHIALLERSRLYRHLVPDQAISAQDWALVRDLMVAMRNTCAPPGSGSIFLLVLLPSDLYDKDPTRRSDLYKHWRAELEEHGVPVLDLISQFDDLVANDPQRRRAYFYADGHTKPIYARWVAEKVAEVLIPLMPAHPWAPPQYQASHPF
jgi:hypothetical protein